MGKLIMASLYVDEASMEIELHDVQRIERVPRAVKEVIGKYMGRKKLNKSGLPSVEYIGPNFLRIIGAFTYGEVSFLEYEGKWRDVEKCDSLLCVRSYKDNATYEELLEGEKEYIESFQKENSEEKSEE